ncbi:MAG: aminopeptidase P family protein [bacterium]|jgi:Xaa-Pro aminopeptidase|nr:aminopeptidase P family protein [candidate division KSB1 bacterium]MDH7560778.1 aminopeptidase P family protein [bacterium]
MDGKSLRHRALAALVWTAAWCVVATAAKAQPAEEYEARREAVRKLLSPRGVAVFKAQERSAESYGCPFRQESNFYYLTGINQPGAVLVLSRRGLPIVGQERPAKEVIFLERPTGGEELTPEQPTSELLIDVARPLHEFYGVFAEALTRADTLYFRAPRLRLEEPLTKELELIEAARLRHYPVVVSNPTGLLAGLRVIKSQAEVELIRKAAQLTCAAQVEAAKSVEPGMWEYEVAALVEYLFRRGDGDGSAFAPIIGSGPNSCRIHYSENKRQMEAGDLLVVDIGASYRHYCADVTRTMPVSGTFSERQRAVYEIVLKAQTEAIAIVKPGVRMSDVHEKAAQVIGQGLVQLGLISRPGEYGKYFVHGTSHQLGLDVHDVGEAAVLQPGMVITVEPGIYIPEENLGVRIEDDVLVTVQGHEVLSAAAPKTVAEVEALMCEVGIGNMK